MMMVFEKNVLRDACVKILLRAAAEITIST